MNQIFAEIIKLNYLGTRKKTPVIELCRPLFKKSVVKVAQIKILL